MDKKYKKPLTSSLHDRSTISTKVQFSRQFSKSSLIQKLPLFATLEQYDNLQKKIETLENEAIRHNKVLNMYVERIEDLEAVVKKLEDNVKKQNLTQNEYHEVPKVCCKYSTLTQTSQDTANYSLSVNRLSVMPSFKEKRRTPKKLTQLSESNISQIDGSGSGGFWTKFTQFFKYRPSVEDLKEQNIYQNEPCFDTELEKVIKHEEYPSIPKVIVECIKLIEIKAKKEPTQGLYRMSGDHVEIQKIRFLIDGNDYNCLKNITDIHTIVGVLKLFLREIKEPLVSVSEIKAFIGSSRDWTLAAVKTKVSLLQKLVKSLPKQNRDTLSFILKHLHRLTRMPLQFVNSQSLAISLTPTIFHVTIAKNADIHITMKENEALTNCLEVMIEYENKIFETNFKKVLPKKYRKKWPSFPCISAEKLALIPFQNLRSIKSLNKK